ncbi:type II toxin-antitoxin system RelE/ParE family toxin [Desulfobacterales bacterium HSG17]|nr:type II toxin-antitoxin system RelE/ParE family toxin [Desulfobacterales bacterium HSG17]
MKYKVYIRPDAETDIESGATWYEMQREGLGDEFLNEVINTFETISDNPYMYVAVHRNTHRALIHRFPFAVYYRIEEDSLVVVAVIHGSRHPKQWKDRI